MERVAAFPPEHDIIGSPVVYWIASPTGKAEFSSRFPLNHIEATAFKIGRVRQGGDLVVHLLVCGWKFDDPKPLHFKWSLPKALRIRVGHKHLRIIGKET